MENTMRKATQQTHPMVLIAATTATIASLAAIASFTGMLPGKASTNPALTATATQVAPPATASAPVVSAPAPAAKPRPAAAPPKAANVTQQAPMQAVAYEPAQANSDWRYANERTTTQHYAVTNAGIDVLPTRPPIAEACRDCGTVESVQEISTAADGSGLGAIAGGLVGGLLGNQMGRGKGNQAATVIAALGGAYAGHEVEKRVRTEKQIQVTVRFDDGSSRTYNQQGATRWQNGDRVRMSNGNLLPV
jgi:outer membrane lipoprotein SlyB